MLSEQFNKYRYIFWYDVEGAMEELVMGLAVEGVAAWGKLYGWRMCKKYIKR